MVLACLYGYHGCPGGAWEFLLFGFDHPAKRPSCTPGCTPPPARLEQRPCCRISFLPLTQKRINRLQLSASSVTPPAATDRWFPFHPVGSWPGPSWIVSTFRTLSRAPPWLRPISVQLSDSRQAQACAYSGPLGTDLYGASRFRVDTILSVRSSLRGHGRMANPQRHYVAEDQWLLGCS